MNSVIVRLLEIKTALINLYNNVRCKVTNTTAFMVDQKNEIYRYYLIQILTKIKTLLQELINLLDTKCELVECSKVIDDKNVTVLLESDHFEGSMANIIEHLNTIELEANVNTNILFKCQLVNDDQSKVCLKEYVLKYNDSSKIFDNTLANILKVNNIVPTQDTKLEITIFKNTRLQQLNILYYKYKDYHLNDFIDGLYEDDY